MGAVDLVVQVESPPSVAAGLQRVGRAGHQVGACRAGVVFPKYRGDLVQSRRGRRADARRARSRRCATRATRSTCSPSRSSRWSRWTTGTVDELAAAGPPGRAVRRRCPDSALHAVLDMLAGRYPSDEFAELRPRLVWDRVAGTLTGRPGAQRLAVTSGGTIPDRGLFGVFLAGRRQAARGSASSTRRWSTSRGSATSSCSARPPGGSRTSPTTGCWSPPRPARPAGCRSGTATRLGRPVELGRAIGAFAARAGRARRRGRRRARLRAAGLDEWAADNLLALPAEQREATGHLPDDRTIVVERFRDELGDWRLAVHSPFGAQVNAPWALAIAARLRERYGVDVAGDARPTTASCCGCPTTDRGAARAPTCVALRPRRDRAASSTAEVGGSALFAARFRECAARALLLPRRDPRPAHAAVAAAAARRPAARRWPASTPTSRSCWRRSASACRTSSTCPAWSS